MFIFKFQYFIGEFHSIKLIWFPNWTPIMQTFFLNRYFWSFCHQLSRHVKFSFINRMFVNVIKWILPLNLCKMLHIFLNIFKIPDIELKYQIFYQNTKYQALFKIPVLASLVFKIPIWQPWMVSRKLSCGKLTTRAPIGQWLIVIQFNQWMYCAPTKGKLRKNN